MSNMVNIVRKYNKLVVNDRTLETTSDHARGEHNELDDEIANGSTGVDGIKGEAIDVIDCMLDIIFQHDPDTTNEELDALMEAKCAKWAANY